MPMTRGRLLPRLCFRSRNSADVAGDEHRRRARHGADRTHGVLRFVVERAVRISAQAEVGQGQIGGDALERRGRADPLDRCDSSRELSQLCVARRPVDRDRDRDPDRGGIVAVDRQDDFAGRRAGRVGVGAGDRQPHAEYRKGEHQQQRRAAQCHRDRVAHHAAGQPVPAPRFVGDSGTAPQGEGVDPLAEQGQQRGHEQQRADGGKEGSDRAARADRVEEALGQDRQRRHRGRDGEAGEDHGAPGGLDHASVRLAAGAVARQLLAVAGDEQKAVVDRQPQSHRGGYVQGEDGGVDELRHHPQDEEGPADRDHSHQQGHRRRDDTAEDNQEQQGQQREGDQLGPDQVAANGVVDFIEARGEPADDDVVPRRADPFDRFVGGVGEDLHVSTVEVAGQQERAAVSGDQLWGAPGERVFHADDSVERAQHPGETSGFAAQGRRAQRQPRCRSDRLDPQDDAGDAVAAGLFDQQVLCPAALTGRIAEASRLQVLLDMVAEGKGEHGEDADRHQDLLRMSPSQVGDAAEHGVLPYAS